jgi:hypothetical protein
VTPEQVKRLRPGDVFVYRSAVPGGDRDRERVVMTRAITRFIEGSFLRDGMPGLFLPRDIADPCRPDDPTMTFTED